MKYFCMCLTAIGMVNSVQDIITVQYNPCTTYPDHIKHKDSPKHSRIEIDKFSYFKSLNQCGSAWHWGSIIAKSHGGKRVNPSTTVDTFISKSCLTSASVNTSKGERKQNQLIKHNF